MKVRYKVKDELILEEEEKENLEVGDNIAVFDEKNRGVLIQLIEMNIEETNRTYRFKILMEAEKNNKKTTFKDWTGWIPSKIHFIEKIDHKNIYDTIKGRPKYKIEIGKTKQGDPFSIDAFDLQGITLIIGKKGSGKSHLSKLLLKNLILNKCRAIVFDINNEYSDLKYTPKNSNNKEHRKYEKSELFDKIVTLIPGSNFKLTLEYVGMDVMYDVLTIPLRLPDASAFSFRNIWTHLERKKYLRINEFLKAINAEDNPHVREALYRRFRQIIETELFTDEKTEETQLKHALEKIKDGGAVVFNLKGSSQLTSFILVQTILSKLQNMLEEGEDPLWIFAEEAHLYLNRTSWEDIITRMRHLGAFQVYITNNPQSLPELIIRQADNIFMFKTISENDVTYISPAANIDPDTLISIARALPFGKCLLNGQITNNFPFLVKVNPLKTIKTGQSRLFLR